MEGPYDLVYVVFNTLFNLVTQDAQVRCFINVAAHLSEGGCFVVEAFVPSWLHRLRRDQYVAAESVDATSVRLDVARHDPIAQLLDKNHVTLSSEGIRVITHDRCAVAGPASSGPGSGIGDRPPPVLAGDRASTGSGPAPAPHGEALGPGDGPVVQRELLAGDDISPRREGGTARDPQCRIAAVVGEVGGRPGRQHQVGVVVDGERVDEGSSRVRIGPSDQLGQLGGAQQATAEADDHGPPSDLLPCEEALASDPRAPDRSARINPDRRRQGRPRVGPCAVSIGRAHALTVRGRGGTGVDLRPVLTSGCVIGEAPPRQKVGGGAHR